MKYDGYILGPNIRQLRQDRHYTFEQVSELTGLSVSSIQQIEQGGRNLSDTGGKKKNLTWTLEGDFLKDYLDMLVSEGQIKQYDGTDRNTMMTSLKDFTKTEIRGIIEEEFEDRMSELIFVLG